MVFSKCRRYFHKNHDITNKLFVIIHADKINAKKERQIFLNKTSSFTQASCFETYKNKKSPHHKTSTRPNYLFPKERLKPYEL